MGTVAGATKDLKRLMEFFGWIARNFDAAITWKDIEWIRSQWKGPIVVKGVLVEVTKGQTTAHVQLDVGGVVVSASITNEAVDELKLKPGQTAYAVIKASDVMVAID